MTNDEVMALRSAVSGGLVRVPECSCRRRRLPSVSWSEIRSEEAFLKHLENGVVGFDRGAGNGWRTP
ncbi:MAG: hypothetical protein OXQ32_02865, partial [bacterium]|nr:hypothetical protein [bacterium]